jgi:uncharacterized protein YaiL (DUF2058 family)
VLFFTSDRLVIMNSSLRDQLLAAGLVTEKQARQAAQDQQRQAQRKQHSDPRAQPQRRGQPQGHGQQQGRGQPQAHGQTQGRGEPQAHGQTQGGGEPQARAQTQAQQPQTPSPKIQAQQAQAAKIARDQELNRRREDKAQRKARIAQIEQIIEQNRLPRLETEDYYSFIDGKRIRRMSVDAQRREQLTKRELAIVRYKGHYAVVPADIAERIRERDENMVVPFVQTQTSSEVVVDDAYKDFVVPDDLIW